MYVLFDKRRKYDKGKIIYFGEFRIRIVILMLDLERNSILELLDNNMYFNVLLIYKCFSVCIN